MDQQVVNARDYFAARAAAGAATSGDTPENIAKAAFAIADAMIRERASYPDDLDKVVFPGFFG